MLAERGALEFVMAEAKASGQDVVIAVGPQHSNLDLSSTTHRSAREEITVTS